MTKQVLALRGKAKRRQARKKLGPLKHVIIAERTLNLYNAAIVLFFQFQALLGTSLATTVAGFGDGICEYIESGWQNGDTRATIGHLISGLCHHVRGLHRHLPCAWRLFTAWGRAELPARAPPMPCDVMWSICNIVIM